MRYWLGLPVCLVALSLTAFAGDMCVAPKQQDVDPKKTPIPLCLVAKKVALTLDEYNNDPKTLKGELPSLSRADFDFRTVGSNNRRAQVQHPDFFGGCQPSIFYNE